MGRKQEKVIPDVCPSCGVPLHLRAEIDSDIFAGDRSYDELWECDNHHIWKAIYKLIEVVQLK